jgi:hypothetical protein
MEIKPYCPVINIREGTGHVKQYNSFELHETITSKGTRKC